MKITKIEDSTLAVLSGCEIGTNIVKITDGQLERKLYESVNKVLVAIGGKWNRGRGGHVFEGQSAEDISRKLESVILTGEIAIPSKNGYFPTPWKLARRLVAFADVIVGQRILEPSAGSGSLVDAILETLHSQDSLNSQTSGPPMISTSIRAIENNPELVAGLATKYETEPCVLLAESDFTFWHLGAPEYGYDRIVMNPPFEDRAEAKHVARAFSMLKPGGKLVSIMSSGVKFRLEKEYALVRQLIEDFGGIEDLPAGSFKESGTMVNTVVIWLEKGK